MKNKSLTTIKHQYKLHEIALKEILISSNIRFIMINSTGQIDYTNEFLILDQRILGTLRYLQRLGNENTSKRFISKDSTLMA